MIYCSDKFKDDLVNLLNNYHDDNISSLEKSIAHTPAKVLEALLLTFFEASVSNGYSCDSDNPILSCTNEEDLTKVLNIMEKIGYDYSKEHGSELYSMFVNEVEKETFNSIIVPEYVMTYVVLTAMLNILYPTIIDSENLIKNKERIVIKKR